MKKEEKSERSKIRLPEGKAMRIVPCPGDPDCAWNLIVIFDRGTEPPPSYCDEHEPKVGK